MPNFKLQELFFIYQTIIFRQHHTPQDLSALFTPVLLDSTSGPGQSTVGKHLLLHNTCTCWSITPTTKTGSQSQRKGNVKENPDRSHSIVRVVGRQSIMRIVSIVFPWTNNHIRHPHSTLFREHELQRPPALLLESDYSFTHVTFFGFWFFIPSRIVVVAVSGA